MNKKEKVKDKRLYKTYGIKLKDFKAKQKEQHGVCWICQQLPRTHLCVDHRHVPKYKKMQPEEKKKEVRALLCFSCNKLLIGRLERFKNLRTLLPRVIEYFEVYKMRWDE